MSNLKIGMVCPFFPPHYGGTEKYVYELSNNLSRSNIITIMTTRYHRNNTDIRDERDNIKILRFDYLAKPLNNPISLSMFNYIIKHSKEFDILNFNDIYSFSTYPSFFIEQKPKILTFHTWLIRYENPIKNILSSVFEKNIFRRIASKMDGLIVLANSQKDYMVRMGINENKIFVIPNGVNTDFFGRDKDKARKYFNIQAKFVIGFFGRFVERKGIKILLDLFKKLKDDLYLFGSGPLKSIISEYVKNYPNIHLIEGPFSEQDVALIHSALDLYVLPSISGEGCPTGILEALSSGTLCLVSDLPENMCLLKDKGLYFQRGNPKDLEEKINEAKAMSIDETDLKNYARKYDWKNISKQVFDVYRILL